MSELNQVMNGEKDAKPAPQPAPTPPEPPPDLRASAEDAAAARAPAKSRNSAAAARASAASQSRSDAAARAAADAASKAGAVAPSRRSPSRSRPHGRKSSKRRPNGRKEPAQDKPKPSHNFDPNTIAKLIGQSKPSTPAVASTQTAALTPQGLPHHDAPHMSMSMASALDAWLTESYLNCWTPPPTTPEGDTYVAQIRVIFNPDGSLSGRPVLLNPPTDRAWRAHAESAMRAVRKCDPLKVPAEYMPFFEQWKVETIHFDPRETQG